MARGKTTTRTLRALRAVLLLGLIGFIVLVVALYRFGRAGLPGAEPRTATPAQGEQPAVMVGHGFDYLVTEGEETIARIRAARILAEREEEIVLEGIDPIEVYRDDGDVYRVFAERGTYDLSSQETVLDGNVRVEAPRGLELSARTLTIGRRGHNVVSRDPVSFRMAGEFVGRASNLRADLKRDIFYLFGNVSVSSVSPLREPVQMSCNRLTYEREARLVELTGDVRFHTGDSHIWAPAVQFLLTDADKVRHVAAQRGVAALYVKRFGRDLVRRTELTGDELAVAVDPESGDPTEGEVRSRAQRTARVWTTDEASVVRSLAAPVLHARFLDGEISYAEAHGTVHLRETLSFDHSRILRWACGDRAEVHFRPDGEIREATFYERVEFRDAQGLALADRIDMTGEPYEIVMRGEPARAVGVQGELTAPTIVQRGERGDIRAEGGVRGLFDAERGRSDLSVGGGKGPIRLTSGSAVWRRADGSFEFQDAVRVWQQENLLVADRVESRGEQNLLVARGSIKTILVPDEAPDAEGGGEPGGEGAGSSGSGTPEAGSPEAGSPEAGREAPRDPIEVTSQWMEYHTDTRNIVYHDEVLITQTGRRMVCDEAEAQLREAGGVEWLDCRGNARVDDNVAGRSVRGDTALYETARGEITFRGRPVILTGEKGERIEGRTLVYDVATGGARIRGEDGR
jgi:lipopolysaccharide export system protein LptA